GRPTNAPNTSTASAAPTVPRRIDPPGTYTADWSGGLDGWPATNGWSAASGQLINNGTEFGNANWLFGLWNTAWVAAPFVPEDGRASYTIEAEIRIVETPECGSFGLVARGLYQAGVHVCGAAGVSAFSLRSRAPDTLATVPIEMDTDWHTYRF